ncbi:MAG TPA: pentapeptide repeat-containing protein [Microbacterium sp.]|nr:pentapeptide repeat-containing protein [Microbacterium sp.]
MARRSEDLRPPLVSAPDLPDHLDPAPPRRSADLIAALIELEGDADLAHSSLEQCVLTGGADSLDLRGATLMDVELRDLRVADLPARTASLRRVRISGGRIGTLDLTDTRIHELELHGVRIDYLTLSATKAVDVRIDGCRITALDLPGATLTRVAFDGTHADEVDSRGLQASHVDLRGLDALSFLDVASLRGTTLTVRQVELLAPAFAASAGISVRD